MTRLIDWLRRARRVDALPRQPHLRRDMGLPELDRPKSNIGAELQHLRGWR